MPQPAIITDLLSFLNHSPTAWHAVDECIQRLNEKGFQPLKEEDQWILQPGQSYYVNRNGSSLCAFIVSSSIPKRIHLLASHTDSPSLKLKPQPEIRKHQAVLFGVEVYGAPLLSSWLNRDLGLAGRVCYIDQQKNMKESLVCLTHHPFTIPQLAIHLDREVNEKGLILNKQEHLQVLAALDENLPAGSYLETLLREQFTFEKVLSFDLFFYPLEPSRLVGFEGQMIASYRIDSLASVHAILQAFLQESQPQHETIKMIMFWDHEEVGSGSAQGAESPFLTQVLERILITMNQNREDYFRILHQSTCLSVDLAHALHPNYADKHDSNHPIFLGKGVTLKSNAQQRYATSARTSALIQKLADDNQLSLQKFVSRNDLPCGTTIGPIQSTQLGIPTVDLGCGQLSMHASRELMACRDHLQLYQLLRAFLK
jgi:aspartyl aminopeptidase